MNFGQCCSWLDDQDVSFRARAGLIRAWVVLAVALFVFSWRLWLSQSDFPQVPFFRITAQVPAAIELLLFSGVLVCLVGFEAGWAILSGDFRRSPCSSHSARPASFTTLGLPVLDPFGNFCRDDT